MSHCIIIMELLSVQCLVFEILGFKLKNENKKKNWRNGPFAISHVCGPIVTKF